MGYITHRDDLTKIKDTLAQCDAQTASIKEDLAELHLIERHRKHIAEKTPSSHTKARHLTALERIEVAEASIVSLSETKTLYLNKLRSLICEVKKVIKVDHADVADATSAGSHGD